MQRFAGAGHGTVVNAEYDGAQLADIVALINFSWLIHCNAIR